METRIARLEELAADAEERLVKIAVRLEQMATKADIHEAANIQIKVAGRELGCRLPPRSPP